MNRSPTRWLLLALACAGLASGCRDKDDDDSTVIVDPGSDPSPTPDPTPNPDPTPDPDPPPNPDPEPEPDPEPPPAPAGWFEQTDAFGTEIFSAVYALDDQRVWVASREVMRTTDGGTTWTHVGTSAGSSIGKFTHLHFFDADVGWGLTLYTVQSTSDGGATWQVRDSREEMMWYTGMSFLSPSTGWVASHGGLMKTADGGQTWTAVSVGEPYDSGTFKAVTFVDATRGWVSVRANGGENVLGTVDGGATWQHQLFHPGQDHVTLRTILAVDATHAFVAGKAGPGEWDPLLYATTDGFTWVARPTDDPVGFRGLTFVDAENGWATGQYIHHTTDGGVTWTLQGSPRLYLDAIHFINQSTGWAVGVGGAILKTTTGGVE